MSDSEPSTPGAHLRTGNGTVPVKPVPTAGNGSEPPRSLTKDGGLRKKPTTTEKFEGGTIPASSGFSFPSESHSMSSTSPHQQLKDQQKEQTTKDGTSDIKRSAWFPAPQLKWDHNQHQWLERQQGVRSRAATERKLGSKIASPKPPPPLNTKYTVRVENPYDALDALIDEEFFEEKAGKKKPKKSRSDILKLDFTSGKWLIAATIMPSMSTITTPKYQKSKASKRTRFASKTNEIQPKTVLMGDEEETEGCDRGITRSGSGLRLETPASCRKTANFKFLGKYVAKPDLESKEKEELATNGDSHKEEKERNAVEKETKVCPMEHKETPLVDSCEMEWRSNAHKCDSVSEDYFYKKEEDNMDVRAMKEKDDDDKNAREGKMEKKRSPYYYVKGVRMVRVLGGSNSPGEAIGERRNEADLERRNQAHSEDERRKKDAEKTRDLINVFSVKVFAEMGDVRGGEIKKAEPLNKYFGQTKFKINQLYHVESKEHRFELEFYDTRNGNRIRYSDLSHSELEFMNPMKIWWEDEDLILTFQNQEEAKAFSDIIREVNSFLKKPDSTPFPSPRFAEMEKDGNIQPTERTSSDRNPNDDATTLSLQNSSSRRRRTESERMNFDIEKNKMVGRLPVDLKVSKELEEEIYQYLTVNEATVTGEKVMEDIFWKEFLDGRPQMAMQSVTALKWYFIGTMAKRMWKERIPIDLKLRLLRDLDVPIHLEHKMHFRSEDKMEVFLSIRNFVFCWIPVLADPVADPIERARGRRQSTSDISGISTPVLLASPPAKRARRRSPVTSNRRTLLVPRRKRVVFTELDYRNALKFLYRKLKPTHKLGKKTCVRGAKFWDEFCKKIGKGEGSNFRKTFTDKVVPMIAVMKISKTKKKIMLKALDTDSSIVDESMPDFDDSFSEEENEAVPAGEVTDSVINDYNYSMTSEERRAESFLHAHNRALEDAYWENATENDSSII